MTIQEVEQKIYELKGKQADHFKKKKADRNASELEAIRTELHELKAQAKAVYRKK